MKKPDIELSTYETYWNCVHRHIIPYFEKINKTISELKPFDIKEFYHHKRTTGRLDGRSGGLSIETVKKMGNIIKESLNEAVMYEYIPSNPALIVKIPKAQKDNTQHVFLSLSEAQELTEAFKGHYLHEIVALTLCYGLRRSEVLGLKWSAVDLANDTLYINHTVVKSKTVYAKDRTKNESSRRSYPLFPQVKELLLLYKERHYTFEDDYIFKSVKGGNIRPDSLTKSFIRRLKRKNLKKMRFHDLRHSTASIMFDSGMNVKEIQEWMGHGDIETTLNIYTHISRGRKKEISDKMQNLMKL